MKNNAVIIAIDGFSSSGKSTMAKRLARNLGYVYLDSGAMYRAVTLYAMEHDCYEPSGLNVQCLLAHLKQIHVTFELDADQRPLTYLNGVCVEDTIRSLAVSEKVSQVSALPEVRAFLIEQQRTLGNKGGIVMDGRDIGTVVFPQADVKIFVQADAAVRAERRYLELKQKGQEASYEAILKNIQMRDHLDQTRSVGPLVKASDAWVLDNGHMSLEEQDQWVMEHVKQVLWQK